MGVGPANPRPDAGVDVERNGITSDGDGAEDFDSGEAHEPDVSAGGKVVVAGKEFVELRSTLVEVDDAQDGVDGRNNTDGDWRAEYEDVSNPGVVGGGPAANIFVNVETMALGDIFCPNVLEAKRWREGKKDIRRTIPNTESPTPIARSMMTARRFSALVIVTDFTDAIW